jgi:hypothetical protein
LPLRSTRTWAKSRGIEPPLASRPVQICALPKRHVLVAAIHARRGSLDADPAHKGLHRERNRQEYQGGTVYRMTPRPVFLVADVTAPAAWLGMHPSGSQTRLVVDFCMRSSSFDLLFYASHPQNARCISRGLGKILPRLTGICEACEEVIVMIVGGKRHEIRFAIVFGLEDAQKWITCLKQHTRVPRALVFKKSDNIDSTPSEVSYKVVGVTSFIHSNQGLSPG